MNVLKLCNADSFRFFNSFTCRYKSYEDSLEICMEKKFTGFVVFKNIAYFRSNTFKDLITNYIYNENSTLYILVPEDYNKFLIKCSDRVEFYTKNIINKQYQFDSKNITVYNINTLKNKIDSYRENQRKWTKQHYEMVYKYLKILKINSNNRFLINPYDNRDGKKSPCLVKSRSSENPNLSVLLPLENIYQPYYMFPKIKDDITFNKKKNSIVWRGTNSGWIQTCPRAYRVHLVEKFYNSTDYNIGFTDMRYSYSKYNKDYIKNRMSIKDQLKYKFILSVEGNDFATNFSWIMLSNSIPICPIHVIETWFMESYLQPYIHYIPVKNDFSDLVEVYNNALNNNELCQEILFKKKLFCANFLDTQKEDNIIKNTITTYLKHCN